MPRSHLSSIACISSSVASSIVRPAASQRSQRASRSDAAGLIGRIELVAVVVVLRLVTVPRVVIVTVPMRFRKTHVLAAEGNVWQTADVANEAHDGNSRTRNDSDSSLRSEPFLLFRCSRTPAISGAAPACLKK
jgi:hypothetical protein